MVTSSPFMVPKEPPKTEVKDDVPKKTKGSAHTKTTIINLGPLRKFLSDSIMVAIL